MVLSSSSAVTGCSDTPTAWVGGYIYTYIYIYTYLFRLLLGRGFFDHVLYVFLRFLFSDAPPPGPGVPHRIIRSSSHEERLS